MEPQAIIAGHLASMNLREEDISSKAIEGMRVDVAEMIKTGFDFDNQDQIKELEKTVLWFMYKHPV